MNREILLLGNTQLYEVSTAVEAREVSDLRNTLDDLHDTLMAYRDRYGTGRAIAAPQIGIMKRIIYMYIDQPLVFINPVLKFHDHEMMEVWDDCMSFPGLYVRVMRYRRCRLEYMDMDWKKSSLELEGDLSELIQHEYDHLDGVLATMRAIDHKSLRLKDIVRGELNQAPLE